MADIRLAKPAAGTTQTVPSAPNGRFIFDFPADAATLTRNGDDLVLTFEDGSSIQLQGFYTTYSKEEMPSFQVEGVEISGQDFFAALGEDLMPAAGPAASSASRSGRYNEYGGSDLLDGIDHLGRLDIGFDGGTQLATDTVEPSAPEVDIDYDVTIAAGPEAGAVDLTVYEGGLAGGSQAGQAATPTTASGSLNINAPDGVASIVIGDVVVYENGKLTGNVVTTDEGTLAVTGYDPVTGKLDFSYTLDRNTTEHDKSDPATDTQISHDLTVTVTDTDGDSASSTITVNVVDDVPIIESFSHEMSEGDAVPVVGSAVTGAVAGADGAKFAWDANQNGHFGTITLNADGTYSYRLDNDNATVKELSEGETLTEEFTYTYTDADGDIATGSVTITINGKDNGIDIEPTDPDAGSDKVTVYESGLADGSQAGEADAPTTASGSLIITAPDGVASIVIGGVVVFENGALTGDTVSTDEGVLTVTDFDPVTGELSFTYELRGNTLEHTGSGMDNFSHDLTVTVTDTDGTVVDGTITVNVVDDVPELTISSDPNDTLEWTGGATGAYTTESGSLTLETGADGLKADSLKVTDAADPSKSATFDAEGKATIDYADGSKLEATYDASTGEISYTYTPGAATQVPNRDFTFSAQDTDGDPTSATVKVEVDLADSGDVPVPGQSIEVDESGLADGTMPDPGMITKPITLPEGYTLNTDGWVAGEDGALTLTVNGGKGLLTYKDGELTYTLQGNYAHADATNPNEGLSDKPTFDLNLTHDATGVEVSTTVTVDVLDDAPEITVTAGNPERGEQTNLTDGTLTSFENYDDSIWHAIEDKHSATICNGQVTMTAGIIYNGQPDTFVDDPYATFDKGFENHSNLEDLSHGLTVNGGIQDYPSPGTGSTDEIAADAYRSEAVQFTLNGLAYGLNLQLGAFFSAGADDPANEIVRVIFYRGDNIVEDITLDSTSVDGVFGKKGEFSQYFAEGFDRVVITAVDNGNSENNSEFVISNIGFVTQPNAMYVTSGTVTAVSGADGFDHAFDGNPHTEFAQADGTAYEDGQQLTLYDAQGEPFTVTLEIKEGTSGGDKVMTAYRTENGAADSSQPVFSVNLDQDGNWTFKQYETFHDSPQSNDNTFELGFVTEDADGDRAFDSESIHLNTGTYGAVAGTADNSNDTIVITGGDGVAGTVAAGDSGGVDVITNVQPGQDYNISIMLDLSGSMNDPSGSAGMSRLAMAKAALTNFINDTLAKHDGEINLQLITFNNTATERDTWVLKRGTTEDIKNYNQGEIEKIVGTLDWIRASGGTNYEAAMEKATEWFSKNTAEGGVAGNGGENLAFFISDGQPTYYNYQGTDWWGKPIVDGEGTHSDQATVQATLEAAQDLQNAGGGVKVNAIGIGTDTSLNENAQTILDLIDNTGGSGQNVASYPYQTRDSDEAWTNGIWHEDQPLVEGDSDLVNSEDDLTAALVGGGVITSTDLADAGDDTIRAEHATSSTIVYGDVMNTDRLRYELIQTLSIAAALVAAGIDYGSGADVFQWLETAANANALKGTKFEGWTHDDSVKYMLQHAEELGYETRVDADGDFYLVKADGTVLNMDGSEAGIDLDSLTGRDGGDDVITGSRASDTIYGQEGDDLLVGDAPSESGEGSTAGSIEGTTVDSIKEMSSDALDAFIESVEGTDADGDDRLFGGTGNDVLLGMGGNDYLDGGAGEDAIFGGAGNDIIVYDKADYLVSGGSGIDFMVSTDSELTMKALLGGTGDGHGPIVKGIEVLLKGEDALSLTSLDQLAKEYGITLDTNAEGKETLILDMDKWTYHKESGVYTSNEGDLTLETNLTPVDASDPASEAVQQQVFTLEHGNG